MRIVCPDYIEKAIDLIQKSGNTAYAVGGCIRDSLMGRIPSDWDMTSSATPEEICHIFRNFRTIPTGIKHGTVTVLIDSVPIEITTMRVDGSYSDNRHPEKVIFTTDISEDLSRRDFTVNAMAYNPHVGLVDPFGGEDDIKRMTIRCVGDADKRFSEDALRILRAVRFSSVLDFIIEQKTSESILHNLNLLENISKERIRVELIKLLCGKSVESVLRNYKKVIFEIIPELEPTDGFPQHTPFHIYDVWNHIINVTANIEPIPNFRVAALLHDIEKPSCLRTDEKGIDHFKGHPQAGALTAEKILRRLRFSNSEINHITTMIRIHDERPDGDKHHLAKLCSNYGIENVSDTLKLIYADAHGKNPAFFGRETDAVALAQAQIEEMKQANFCLSIRDLDINGNDIMNLGIDRTEIKETLEYLLDRVINEELQNKKSDLSDAIISRKKSVKILI